MITILTTINYDKKIADAIKTVHRLEELILVVHNKEDIAFYNSKVLIVNNNCITTVLDWFDLEPPYIFSEIHFTTKNLLAMIFFKLGNHQKAFEFLSEDNILFHEILAATNLQFGYQITENTFSKIRSKYNQCILQHYGNCANKLSLASLKECYSSTIKSTEKEEEKAFLIKHYCNLLLDTNAFSEATTIVNSFNKHTVSSEAKNALNIQLAYALMRQLQQPYAKESLVKIATLFKQSIDFYEEKNLKINAGLLYIEASEIANFQEDYIESKNLINKAILYFKEEDVPEFLGEAGLRKATLLYTWSKNGSPQYYKPAINAFQDTLKVFKRDTHPQKFADVHHNLALIYSEIPVSAEEKPIWTAFCASSFKEVLNYYTKEKYPYEYAMTCHNYATALMSFPEAKLHNNLDKAAGLFTDALSIRTAEQYPFERAITLVNQLELFWLLHNNDDKEEIKNFSIMQNKAQEIKQLTTDMALIEKANNHLENLKKLKTILN